MALNRNPHGAPGDPTFVHNPVIRQGRFPLILGDVMFSTEECPSKLNIGSGEQMLVDINLPGGGKISQDFGNKAADVRWTGKFYGPNIAARVATLRAYRISAVPQNLFWSNEQYQVRIKSFDPGYMGGHNEYEIVLSVIQDLNGAFTITTPPTIDAQVTELLNLASGQNGYLVAKDPSGSAAFQQQIANIISTIAQYAPLAQYVVSGQASILGAIQTAITAIEFYQGSLSPAAAQIPYVLGLISSLQAIAANVQQGVSTNALAVFGGDLFSYAARQSGDIAKAFTLANANSRVYPLLNPGILRTIALPLVA